ncbi:M23 family metallopeptidase [Streptomyces alboniger]|uniref:M23 family peptidase n=1 Tax=Streptomyces alboniger TaxID=132473 RepID=A0A5J6HJV2_STRAD|nr:M23 family metallopeptidase [Streptomyces alboniger]QEV19728.1 M23 family peptidase [Streptomyces alboniger]
MNDRHPSGSSTPQPSAPGADYPLNATYDQQSAQPGGYGYDTYSTGGFDTGSISTGSFDTGTFATDPLFGDMPGTEYDTGQWATTPSTQQQTSAYDAYAAQHHAAAYETGSYDTTSVWSAGGYQQLADIPSQPGPDSTGQWDTASWDQGPATGQWQTQTFDTGAYDATAWNSADETREQHESPEARESHESNETPQPYELTEQYEISAEAPFDSDAPFDSESPYDGEGPYDTDVPYASAEPESVSGIPAPTPRTARGKSGGSGAGRSRTRRRTPAKRSALLTVAVPSACVMGVAGVAAASVGSFGGDGEKETTASAPDTTSVKPSTANSKLDTQLANLSADAGDFADRASRTQERIDLKAEKVAAQKKAAAEAARKERLRPKFALPVKQHGLSAQYGQAGVNWMSAHSGIDFPVSYGTEVFAATDGTVTTKWNSAYGNMAIVTAKDGTETWYCHLSSHKISSGPVKAGETIAYSGNSGNSTGPHLHFEVRPSGSSAIDPLPWLRSHGLDPT